MTLIDKHFEEAFTRPTVLVFPCLCVSYFWKTRLRAWDGTPPGANARARVGRSLVRWSYCVVGVVDGDRLPVPTDDDPGPNHQGDPACAGLETLHQIGGLVERLFT